MDQFPCVRSRKALPSFLPPPDEEHKITLLVACPAADAYPVMQSAQPRPETAAHTARAPTLPAANNHPILPAANQPRPGAPTPICGRTTPLG